MSQEQLDCLGIPFDLWSFLFLSLGATINHFFLRLGPIDLFFGRRFKSSRIPLKIPIDLCFSLFLRFANTINPFFLRFGLIRSFLPHVSQEWQDHLQDSIDLFFFLFLRLVVSFSFLLFILGTSTGGGTYAGSSSSSTSTFTNGFCGWSFNFFFFCIVLRQAVPRLVCEIICFVALSSMH